MTLASEALEETTLANRKVEKMEKVVAEKKMQLAVQLHSIQAKTASQAKTAVKSSAKSSAKRIAAKSSSLQRVGCDEIKKRRLHGSIIKQMDQDQNCL